MNTDRSASASSYLGVFTDCIATWWRVFAGRSRSGRYCSNSLPNAGPAGNRRLAVIIREEKDAGRPKFPSPTHRALAIRPHKWSSSPKWISSRAAFSTSRNTGFSRFLKRQRAKSTAAIASWPKPAWVKSSRPRPHPDRTKRATLRFARQTASAWIFWSSTVPACPPWRLSIRGMPITKTGLSCAMP